MHLYILLSVECVHLSKRENWDEQFNGQTWRAQWSDVKNGVEQPSKKTQSLSMPIVAPPVLRPTVVSYKGFLLSIGGVIGEEP